MSETRRQEDPAATRLRGLVVDVPDFPAPGVVFRDISRLLADADAFRACANALAHPWRSDGVDLVAGVESRGFILGAAVAHELGAGFVPIRKQGKLPRRTLSVAYELEYGSAVLEVHEDAALATQRVLVVDDVLATGGTAAAAVSLVRQVGAQLVGVSFLLELSALGGATRLDDVRHATVLRY